MDNREVTQEALDMFWEHVASSFPDIATGDLSPCTVMEFERIAEKAVNEWVYLNNGEEDGY